MNSASASRPPMHPNRAIPPQLKGIELNEEGFQKVSAEITLAPMGGNVSMPWGKERVQLYFGEVLIDDTFEPIIIRKGFVRRLLPAARLERRAIARTSKFARTPSYSSWPLRKRPRFPRKVEPSRRRPYNRSRRRKGSGDSRGLQSH